MFSYHNYNTRWFKRHFWDLLLGTVFVAGLTIALVSGISRYKVEVNNKDVEIIIPFSSVEELSRVTDTPIQEVLLNFHRAGATTLLIEEINILQAAQASYLSIIRSDELQLHQLLPLVSDILQQYYEDLGQGKTPAEPIFLLWEPGRLPDWLKPHIENRIEGIAEFICSKEQMALYKLTSSDEIMVEELLSQGIGYPADQIEMGLDAGFKIAYRPSNLLHLKGTKISSLLPNNEGANLILFSDKQIPGYPGSIYVWAQELEEKELKVAWIESNPQSGVEELFNLGLDVIRLHSISKEELVKMDSHTAVSRWVRAVRERGIRALYLNLFFSSDGLDIDLVSYNTQYVRDIVSSITAGGYLIGEAPPLTPLGHNQSKLKQQIMIWAGLISFIWLVRRFFKTNILVESIFISTLAICSGWLLLSDEIKTLQLSALLSAVTLPSLATIKVLTPNTPSKGWLDILRGFVTATIISLSGALLVVGLLAQTSFQIGIAQFVGVKAMHILPPIIVFLGIIWQRPADSVKEAISRVKQLINKHVHVKWILMLLVVGFLGGLMVLRTGNYYLFVSSVELKIREFLETVLKVRPRTKEFLIGHPILWLALSRIAMNNRFHLALFGALGAIGQLSMVNTFAHIHSPLGLSIIRTILGLFLGSIIGVALIWIYDWFWKKKGYSI